MWINPNCNLVLSNVFEYDIIACHWELLQNIGWDMSNIPYNDKTIRNIKIGLLQKNNPKLAHYLLDNTEGIIQYYLDKNNVKLDDIVIRVRDGLFLKTCLKDNTSTLPIEFRGVISKFIITLDRKKYLYLRSTGDIHVKGIANKPIDTSFYDLFKTLNFMNKTDLIRGLENIRLKIYQSENVKWFTFNNNNNFQIPIIGIGNIEVSKSGLNYIDHAEIDKKIIWEEYIWPFVQPILLYCN
jgi:hypothetical protein